MIVCSYIATISFLIRIKTHHSIFKITWCMDLCFFFSSRRRHTRFKCDWSSDVCSSDLGPQASQRLLVVLEENGNATADRTIDAEIVSSDEKVVRVSGKGAVQAIGDGEAIKIGRASCRERV